MEGNSEIYSFKFGDVELRGCHFKSDNLRSEFCEIEKALKSHKLTEGHIILYHGNVCNYNNRETHKLGEPLYILEQRIYEISRMEYVDIGLHRHNIYPKWSGDYELFIEEQNHNAPVKYSFVFKVQP